ncbi:MAG: PAS domain S-box protein, partial [Bacteroidota bacterium]|nr:PAS domain S-box protein [Bacteroidota bacterium]
SHVHPDDRERVVLYPDQVKFGTMTLWTEEYRFLKANGKYAHVLDKGIVIRDENGVGTRMVGAMRDITKNKQEERQLKLLESVVTNTNDAVIITDAEHIHEPGPRILYVNEAFTEMTGYGANEVLGKTPRILHGPNTNKAILKRVGNAIAKREPYEFTVINYKKSGEEFWVNCSMTPVIDNAGKLTHFIAIERDITQQLKYIKAIEKQNKNLRKIAWLQSHVIRAPLARIMGLVDLIKNSNKNDDEHQKALGYLLTSANELDDVIKNIIDTAKDTANLADPGKNEIET